MLRIHIERHRGYYGMIRTLRIVVDGVPIGRIRQGESMVVEVPAGSREIWGEMDWGKTGRLNLENYHPGMTLVLKAYFTLNLFKNLGLAKLPFKAFFRDDAPESAITRSSDAPNLGTTGPE